MRLANRVTCLATVLVASSAQAQTPVYFAGTGHWYRMVVQSQSMSWVQCRDAAAAMGGYLATILSQGENDFVRGLLPSAPFYAVNIGGYERNGEGDWQWVSGEPWGYTHWNVGEPNNGCSPVCPPPPMNENMVQMYGSNLGEYPAGTWSDGDSLSLNPAGDYGFIVEYDTDPSAPTCPGNALQFDGVDDEVDIPHDPSLSFGPGDQMTVELWFKLSEPRSLYHLLGKRVSCSNTNYQLAFGSGELHFSTGPSPEFRVGTLYTAPVGQWVHVAATCDGSNLLLYVNGQLKASETGSLGNTNNEPLRIGQSGTCDGQNRFAGSIDEVRIWNVARSASDIAANFGHTVDPNSPGLVGYWNFDEALTSQTVLDRSSASNNGTLGASAASAPDDPTRVMSTAPLGGVACSPVLAWPLAGSPADRTVTLPFGVNWPAGDCPPGTPKLHTGMDLSATIGESVFAPEAGTVRAVVDGTGSGYAYAVTIEHQGYTTVCWHINPGVAEGQAVARGQAIGTIADIGTGSHLHFGVRLAAYSNISNRGALPVSDCDGDPAFPDGFIDPVQLRYDYVQMPFRFVHLTDIHIGAEGADDRFQTAVDCINRMTNPSRPLFVVISGDLAGKSTAGATPEQMHLFKQIASGLVMPWYPCPGNHDLFRRLASLQCEAECSTELYQDSISFNLDSAEYLPGGSLKLISMNSGCNEPGCGCLSKPQGYGLTPLQFSWLSDHLAESPGISSVLFMHHPTVWCSDPPLLCPTPNCATACIYRLRDQLWDMLQDPDGNGNRGDAVKIVLAGHVHWTTDAQYASSTNPYDPLRLSATSWLSTADHSGQLPLHIITPSASEDCVLRIIEVDGEMIRVGPIQPFMRVATVEMACETTIPYVDPPARLHVYDLQGRHVGTNSQGALDREIAGSYYNSIPAYDQGSGAYLTPFEFISVPLNWGECTLEAHATASLGHAAEEYVYHIVSLDSCRINLHVTLNATQRSFTYSNLPVDAGGEGTVFVHGDSSDPVVYWDDDGDSIPDRQFLPDCYCPCQADPQCDYVTNLQDVVLTVNVAFRGSAPVFDPNCPRERTDVNCDGFSTVQDVVKVVNVAFRGANPATEFCNPCAP